MTFAEVHRHYQDTLFEYLLQRVKSEGVALDLTQDVFIMAYCAWDATSVQTRDQALSSLLALADAEAEQFLRREGRFRE